MARLDQTSLDSIQDCIKEAKENRSLDESNYIIGLFYNNPKNKGILVSNPAALVSKEEWKKIEKYARLDTQMIHSSYGFYAIGGKKVDKSCIYNKTLDHTISTQNDCFFFPGHSVNAELPEITEKILNNMEWVPAESLNIPF